MKMSPPSYQSICESVYDRWKSMEINRWGGVSKSSDKSVAITMMMMTQKLLIQRF